MWLIGTLDGEAAGHAFSSLLKQKNIDHQIDIRANTDWGSAEYGTVHCDIWIIDKEQIPQANQLYREFIAHPPPPASSLPILNGQETEEKVNGPENEPMGWITRLVLIVCCALFILSYLTSTKPTDIPSNVNLSLLMSPVEKALLYDYPHFYELVDQFLQKYGYKSLQDTQNLPSAANRLLQTLDNTPYWHGIYPLLLGQHPPNSQHAILFEKIRQGEVWRLVSPVFLHGDLLHIFFNMLWLIVLGKQMERRLKPLPYIIFMIIVAIFSNTVQYLVSGPNFIGFSGILCGMLTFIWQRQRLAAWEGYQLDRITFNFMLLFIGGMAFLQLISFIGEWSFDVAFSPNLANSAHLSGALIGYGLGKLDFFSWRQT